jgi:mannose-6-phosphate isomerase
MYPLKFNNIYFYKIWGGKDFNLFRDNLPDDDIGESWDVSCHSNGVSVVSNGKFEGKKLDALIEEYGAKIVGKTMQQSLFPLLVKLINSKDKLSVQVHPSDEYASNYKGEHGKTEAWYVLEAFEDANLIVGTKECTKEQFKLAIETGDLDKYLNKVPVKKGDVFFIQSGLVHAIGEGTIIAEVQQSSDTTYRVYDYNRGRELHIDKALDVIDLSLKGEIRKGVTEVYKGYSKTEYIKCEYFSFELYDINSFVKECSDIDRFYIFTCVEGNGTIQYKDGVENISLGESILIPAALGEYTLKGKMKVLKSAPTSL